MQNRYLGALFFALTLGACSPEASDPATTPETDGSRDTGRTGDVDATSGVPTRPDIGGLDSAGNDNVNADDGPSTDDSGEVDVTDVEDGNGDTADDAATDAGVEVPETTDAIDVADLPACLIDCDFPGQTTCDARGFLLTCSDPDRDECFEFGSPRNCAAGTRCLDGACIEDDCENECPSRGATECVDGSTVRLCGNVDDDACLEWAEPTACAGGGSCTAGACVGPCEDDCTTEGATQCVGTRIATCGNSDADECLDLSTAVNCPAGETCIDGACVERPVSDQCILISEYIEGTSSNKAFEIQNCGTLPFDTRGLGLCLHSNGNTASCNGGSLFPTVTIAPGDVYTICVATISPTYRSLCDTTSSVANFNGNDIVTIFEDVNGSGSYDPTGDIILDAFGSRTDPPSTEIWANMTLRRCRADAFPSIGAFDFTEYFTRSGVDDFSDLGQPAALDGCP